MEDNTGEAETRVGKGMLYVGWIIALAVLVFIFSDFEDSRRNPNKNLTSGSSATDEVVLQQNNYGQYLFTGLANGKEIDFLVDTGAYGVIFTEKQANELGLEKGFEIEVRTANGDTYAYSTRLEKLQIGPIELYDVLAAIQPNMEGEALLGMSALGELEWSQRGNELTIRQ